MSGELRYTEKEMVMAQRMAFWDGANAADAFHHNSVVAERIRFMAEERYPLPKVERPRVVTDKQGVDWRVIGDVAHARFDADHSWESRPIVSMTKDRALLIADLFARPSEFVDDEG